MVNMAISADTGRAIPNTATAAKFPTSQASLMVVFIRAERMLAYTEPHIVSFARFAPLTYTWCASPRKPILSIDIYTTFRALFRLQRNGCIPKISFTFTSLKCLVFEPPANWTIVMYLSVQMACSTIRFWWSFPIGQAWSTIPASWWNFCKNRLNAWYMMHCFASITNKCFSNVKLQSTIMANTESVQATSLNLFRFGGNIR